MIFFAIEIPCAALIGRRRDSGSAPSSPPSYTPIVLAMPTRPMPRVLATLTTEKNMSDVRARILVRVAEECAGEMDDAGDAVPFADLEERLAIPDIHLFEEDMLVDLVREQGVGLGRAALREHAALAELHQGTRGVGADETEAAGDKDHRSSPISISISKGDCQCY